MTSMKITPVLYASLTYAGSVPFIACAVWLASGTHTLELFGETLEVSQILGIYAVIIASFMAGAHWGQHVNRDDVWAVFLSLSSNACAIILFFAYVLLSFPTFLILAAILFLYLLYVDGKLYKAGHISHHYIKTRCGVTVIVFASLLVSWWGV